MADYDTTGREHDCPPPRPAAEMYDKFWSPLPVEPNTEADKAEYEMYVQAMDDSEGQSSIEGG